MDWYGLAESAVTKWVRGVQAKQPVSLKDLVPVARGIVESLKQTDQIFGKVLIPSNPSLIHNLVHVAIVSAKVGLGLGYSSEQLLRLTLAGLVHDVGMFLLPNELLETHGRWSREQITTLHRHPLLGADTLKPLSAEFPDLPTIVMQEHERLNGKGYPNGLKGDQIHDFALIIGIADMFDAVQRARPYRPRMLPHQAIREVLVVEKDAFPIQVIKSLVQQCSLFPIGTPVRLNTGEIGLVVQANPRYPLRPVVRITRGADQAPPHTPKLLDLSRLPLVHIIEAVPPEGSGGVRAHVEVPR
ncbi:MAG: HD-GYP domain-containing protein [Nitrospirales bacterium]